ncbi:MAG TPA: Uma2 family endonuclease [Oscillatoriales cyanobacterium M59_W2019_021]|nr:Uma2 family endonuclease [Oscillatoriales cyanobacterium M4454_W2019_049]HIK49619.1 Uma2 family endonuclease [Oscillatoriales cyanobacterium M59_W2019_021]
MSVSLPPVLELKLDLTDEQFWQLCRDNSDLQFECTSHGEILIMAPTGSVTGERNADPIYQLQAWNRRYKLGKVFDHFCQAVRSLTFFLLPWSLLPSAIIPKDPNLLSDAGIGDRIFANEPICTNFDSEKIGRSLFLSTIA